MQLRLFVVFLLASAGGAVAATVVTAVALGALSWPMSGPSLFVGCALLLLAVGTARGPSQP